MARNRACSLEACWRESVTGVLKECVVGQQVARIYGLGWWSWVLGLDRLVISHAHEIPTIVHRSEETAMFLNGMTIQSSVDLHVTGTMAYVSHILIPVSVSTSNASCAP